MEDFKSDIGLDIWNMKYRYKDAKDNPIDNTIEDTWQRVANAVAQNEKSKAKWSKKFYSILEDYKFLPAGRILSNAGTSRQKTTMFNCYVMNVIEDSMEGIFETVKEAALTQKQGGGVGFDFSTIRPSGEFIKGVESQASGPVSFMQVFDATCRTVMSAGHRRGAQMALLSVSHPDIEEFISAKRQNEKLQMFNLSVAVSDDFMQAVEENRSWDLIFDGVVHKTVMAQDLFDKIMKSTYDYAEPGFILIDRINRLNNLWYCEDIRATNPCGEQPLPPYGACLLGSLNLTKFVKNPFTAEASVDYKGIEEILATAVRFLDNVIDISNYPLDAQKKEAQNKRRMGIGITGLADMFAMLTIKYGSAESLEVAAKVMSLIRDNAYLASSELAKEKGAFPLLETEKYLKGEFIKCLPKHIRKSIAENGIRNSHLTSIAPTGTISLLAGNVSSGLEPIFALAYNRRIRAKEGEGFEKHQVCDYAYKLYKDTISDSEEIPEYFSTSESLKTKEHVDIQATLQKYVDSSISKTVNVDRDCDFEDFKEIYFYAYKQGCKGCTTFRPNDNFSAILEKKEDAQAFEDEVEGHEPESILERPVFLEGTTYKIKTPLSKQALYITINDKIEGNSRHPFEIFINSKNLQHFSWIVAMTRLISAVFRRTHDPSFLVEELKSIFDPNGGYFKNGRYIPSLVAEIGYVIEQHLVNIGLAPEVDTTEHQNEGISVSPSESEPLGNTESMGMEEPICHQTTDSSLFMICPQCNERSLFFQENCSKCISCGYSKCS